MHVLVISNCLYLLMRLPLIHPINNRLGIHRVYIVEVYDLVSAHYITTTFQLSLQYALGRYFVGK